MTTRWKRFLTPGQLRARRQSEREAENVAAMGNQSQRRNKPTQRIRQRPTYQLKHKPTIQKTMEGGKEFDPEKDCVICAAKARNVRAPKRAHHDKCPKNKKFKARQNPPHQRLMDMYQRKNNKPLEPKEKWGLANVGNNASARKEFFNGKTPSTAKQPVQQSAKETVEEARLVSALSFGQVKQQTSREESTIAAIGTRIDSANVDESSETKESTSDIDTSMEAATLRAELDKQMLDNNKKPPALQQKMIPEPIVYMVNYILKRFPERFKSDSNKVPDTPRAQAAFQWYQQHFQNGTATFTFPLDDKDAPPSPFYHSIEGMKVVFLFWELMVPRMHLCCTNPDCDGELIRTRNDFAKRRTLFPIFDFSGDTTWCVINNYCCNKCKKCVAGNDGELLQSLPSHVRQEYPVDPRFATRQDFHLSYTFSDWLKTLLITDTNGDKIAKSVVKKMGNQHTRRVDSYLDQCAYTGVNNARGYPAFHEWIGRFPPSGEHLRNLFNDTSRSALTISGISDFERSNREIQSVECKTIMSQDHTMDIVKNYPRSLGAKAVWDVSTETGEIATLVAVSSTAASQYAHAAESLARREHFNPKVMYSDTWPNGEDFWELLFGSGLKGRLGLFHFVKRIISTLRPSHPDYRRAISALRKCIYRYEATNEANVIRALKNGALGGQKCNDDQIHELRDSPRWKRLCDPYLRKIIFDGDKICLNLAEWFNDYKVDNSHGTTPGRGRLNPETGQKLFTPDTKPAIEAAKTTCMYLADVLPPEDMYRSIKPSSRSKHGLELQNSNRGESRLESFHGSSAHMANTSMRPSLSDSLTIEGTADFNTDIRERIKYEQMEPAEKELIPAWLHGQPFFYNDADMETLNGKAAYVGAPPPYSDVRPVPKKNNGEVFLSQYLLQQQWRNENMMPHPENDRCQCKLCANNIDLLPHQVVSAPPNSVWNVYTKRFVPGSSSQARAGSEQAGNDDTFPTEAEAVICETTAALNDDMFCDFGDIDVLTGDDKQLGAQSTPLPVVPKESKETAYTVPLSESMLAPVPQSMLMPATQQSMLLPASQSLYVAPQLRGNVPWMPWQHYSSSFHTTTFPSHTIVENGSVRKRKKRQVDTYCCSRMETWCRWQRIGRMPHDEDCFNREKNKNQKRQRKGAK